MMNEPEISRRCLSCGASVRSRARYCPQCGREMVRPSEEAAGAPEMPSPISAPVAPITSFEPPPERNVVPSVSAERKMAATVTPPSVPVAEKKEVEVREPVRRSVAPVTVVEAKPDERFGPGVERLRQASTVVLDEAADDPEVRFLLVAAFLFILFLLVLIITSFIK